jgi:hypothetical protein
MVFTYRKWTISLFTSLAIFCLLYPLIIYYFYFPITLEIIWTNNLLNEKERLASDIKGNKLVFGGGSGTLYGVRTKDIQDESGIPSINMAVHAGLNIDYYLHRLKKSLQKGDIVILPLEYNHFIYDGEIVEVTADYIMKYDRSYLETLNFTSKFNYILSISPINMGILLRNYFVRKIYGSFFRPPPHINSHGDIIDNVGSDKINRVMESMKPVEIQQNNFIETEGMRAIKDFDIWCKNNNITCYITYANTIFFKEYDSIPYRKYFRELQEYFNDHKILTLGTPYDFFFNKNLFYDTRYHLNQQGMTIRTRQLMKMIESCGVLKPVEKNPLSSQRSTHPPLSVTEDGH